MENCFVKKLNASVTDNTLPVFEEIVFKTFASQSGDGSDYIVDLGALTQPSVLVRHFKFIVNLSIVGKTGIDNIFALGSIGTLTNYKHPTGGYLGIRWTGGSNPYYNPGDAALLDLAVSIDLSTSVMNINGHDVDLGIGTSGTDLFNTFTILGGSASIAEEVKLKRLQVIDTTNNNAVIHDLKPALVNGVGCLRDIITEQNFYQSTGELIVG